MKKAFFKLKEAFKNNLKANKSFKSQIPNILTCSRALAPITVAPLILTGNIIPGLIIASLLASTDFFDGLLARKLHAESEFGRLADSIVDKIFSVTLLLVGSTLNPIIILNIIPEVAISINNARAFNEGQKVKSSLIGKLKTWLLSINILISFIPGINNIFKVISSFVTLSAQSVTYVDYKIKTCSKKTKMADKIIINSQLENSEDKNQKKTNTFGKKKAELLNYKNYIMNIKNDDNNKIKVLKLDNKKN